MPACYDSSSLKATSASNFEMRCLVGGIQRLQGGKSLREVHGMHGVKTLLPLRQYTGFFLIPLLSACNDNLRIMSQSKGRWEE